MGEILTEIGDLIFTMVIGYLGAVEFLYVVRHLYHWSFRHPAAGNDNDADTLQSLQQNMRQQIAEVEDREALAGGGANIMQDGVRYQDGFRIDEQDKPQTPEMKEQRRKEIEAELARQKQIEVETRQQLEKAEAELEEQRQQAVAAEVKAQREVEENTQKAQRKLEEERREAEESTRKILETERLREETQRKKEEEEEEEKSAAENARKLIEAERKLEEEQRKIEEAAEQEAAEKAAVENEQWQREEEQRRIEEATKQEAMENERKLVEAEQQREEEQRRKEEEDAQQEIVENERKLLEAEQRCEEDQRKLEAEGQEANEPIEAEREFELHKQEANLAAAEDEDGELTEQMRLLIEAECERERKLQVIEENARKFLEAEQEMVELQEKMMEAELQRLESSSGLESEPPTPVVEEPCIKKIIGPRFAAAELPDLENERLTQTVKTQFRQSSQDEPYLKSSKTLLFPDISDDGTSIEPSSSKQSSFSTQPSEEVTITGADEVSKSIAMQFPQIERQEPDGEDNLPSIQYTDEYLRSLDGIKHRPLVREDGSGRRRAFKKRRSSGSSTSSRESRHSREEELKMFTSLEEEEMQNAPKGEVDYTPIKYSSEPTLKVKGHHRRHKRSPAKDTGDENQLGSLEMLGEEENTNPWGELVPEHYKDTAFWKREKAMSIDEEELELEKTTAKEEVKTDAATNIPKTSSFEEATPTQSVEALSGIQKQLSKDAAGNENEMDTTKVDNARSDTKTNLQASHNTEVDTSPARSSASPRLRRSPRIDEINQYEERWKETESSSASAEPSLPTPTISIQESVDSGPWRDEYGLIMQGLSDFYDFQASVNPSRSRSTSRNPSPANSPPSSPQPKNISFNMGDAEIVTEAMEIITNSTAIVDVYDDTCNFSNCELRNENLRDFIESFSNETRSLQTLPVEDLHEKLNHFEVPHTHQLLDTLQTVSDDRDMHAYSDDVKVETVPMICIANAEQQDMNDLVQSLRNERVRSRSRSPLPTSDNIERSLETRQKSDMGSESPIIEISTTSEFCEVKSFHQSSEDCSKENMSLLVESLRSYRSGSRSRSRSPLPTAENIQRSLDSRRTKLIQHNDEVFEKLKLSERTPSPVEETHTEIKTNIVDTPTISIECDEENAHLTEDTECSQENISSLVQSLRIARSRSRSKSPMRLPTAENVERSMALRRNKLIERNDEVIEQLIERARTPEPPRLTVEYIYQIVEDSEEQTSAEGEYQGISIGRRPRSRESRSRSPSRSQSESPSQNASPDNVSRSIERFTFVDRPNTEPNFEETNIPTFQKLENLGDCYDFHVMLNLEASQNRTLIKNSEELESSLAEKQRILDEEALHKLKTAVEEIELRTLTPSTMEHNADKSTSSDSDENDNVGELTINDRMKKLRCSPTTPDYDRSISEECRDVQRIKNDMLTSGFKRSTYAGESMDLGSEFEVLRRETAQFRRSQSPSPSFSGSDLENARKNAIEKRRIQDEILAELTSDTESNKLGAKPKTDHKSSKDYERSISKEALDTQRIKDELLNSGFKRSTYVGESVDFAAQLEDLRRETAKFKRSNSRSRSPLDAEEIMEVEKIDTESAKRELQDKILDEIEKNTINFQDFSRHLNTDFLDNERRASDSALMQKPELLIQFQESDSDLFMEPDEYHHFRRYSLCQEQPVEEYPNDDYVYVSQIEVQTLTGTRTWIREDYYSENFDNLKFELSDSKTAEEEVVIEALNENEELMVREEEYSDGSEDERQTVVDVDDEIDTDICDFNERGPADESHHEQSECEEAEREMDRYAGRGANDWDDVEETNEIVNYEDNENAAADEAVSTEEGAVGGNSVASAYDSDSFTIDQIYNDAIRSRKQSGILRDYDCILQDMQNNFMVSEVDGNMISDGARYALWAKTRNMDKYKSNSFLDSERRDHEMRYLGDAKGTARQSARLHSRYGYVPLLQSNDIEDVNVDLNYKPKREYNWRKNFKLDDEPLSEDQLNRNDFEEYFLNDSEDVAEQQYLDMRRYSLGGESVTLFSRSPERDELEQVIEEETHDNGDVVIYAEPDEPPCNNFTEKKSNTTEEPNDKPKKKKSKKKTRKESKASVETCAKDEEDDSENQIYSRRSSSLQMETDSPKRKSRSRRSSKSSLTNESPLFSPRSSVGVAEPVSDIVEEYAELQAAPLKKKTKKRKKAKESFAQEAEIQEEQLVEIIAEPQDEVPSPLSRVITPESSSANLLATLSPQNSVCVTPASTESETGEQPTTTTTSNTTTSTTPITAKSSSTTTTPATPVDTFDIMKDANFYPLF